MVDPRQRADRGNCVGLPAEPDGRQDRRAEHGGLEHRRNGNRDLQDVGFDPVPCIVPGGPAGHDEGVDPHARLEDRRRDVAEGEGRGLEDGPRQVRAAVRERQSHERAPRRGIPDRRALAGEVGQEEQPVGTRADAGRFRDERVRAGPAQHGVVEPVERLTSGHHRAADEPTARQRSGGGPDPGGMDGLVPVDGQAAGRATGVDGVAGIDHAGSVEARERIDRARDHGHAGREAEAVGHVREERSQDRAGVDDGSQPLARQPSRGRLARLREHLSERAGRRRDPRETERGPLPGVEVPARCFGCSGVVMLQPPRRRQDPQSPAAQSGSGLESRGFRCGSGVHPRDGRVGRAAGGVHGNEGRALADDADRGNVPGFLAGPTGHEPAHDCAKAVPPRLGVLLGAPGCGVDVDRVGRPGGGNQSAAIVDQPALDLGRAEVDGEDDGAGAHGPHCA